MKSLTAYRKQTAFFRLANLILAIAPLWLTLAVANTFAQTRNNVSASTATTSIPSDTVLGVGNVGDLLLRWKQGVGSIIQSGIGAPIEVDGIVYSCLFDNEPLALNASTGATLWTVDTLASDNAAVANGIFYFVGEDGKVYALNASTGARLWSFATGVSYDEGTSPTVVNGVVYIGANDHNVYALNATTGAELWSFPTGGSGFSFAVANGVVYFGSTDNNVYALNAGTGAKLWSDPIAVIDQTNALTVANGVVYFGSTDNNIYALNASSGAKVWSFATLDSGFTPLIANGVVYVGSSDGTVSALNAGTGARLWTFENGGLSIYPFVVANQVVYVGSLDGNVYALNASTGAKVWSFTAGGGGYILSVVVANGVVYTGTTGTDNSNLYALDASTGAKLWSYAVPSSPHFAASFSAITVEDGVVYATVSEGDPDPQELDEFAGENIFAFSLGADLFLRIQPTPATVRQGDLITYAFPVWNLGPANADFEVLNTQVPAGTTLDYIRISGTPGLGTCTAPPYQGTGQIVCHENSAMAPNTTWTVRVVVKVTAPAGTVITESATTTEDTLDPNLANNMATISTTVQ